MGKPITAKINRTDPYRNFRFRIYFGTWTVPVAGISKVGGLDRSSDVVAHKPGDDAGTRKDLGRTKYEAITLERGVTHDPDFAAWANGSIKKMRRQLRIERLDETGQPARRYLIHGCWVSECRAMPDLDAGSNAVAIQHLNIENEGWEVARPL